MCEIKSRIIIWTIAITIANAYCPPLQGPKATYLRCKDPFHGQNLNCSTSWLPKGTNAFFKCFDIKTQKMLKGRIICCEDGMNRYISKREGRKYSFHLPCGIKKNLTKQEIHVYGYNKPAHYILKEDAISNGKDFGLLAKTLHNEFRKKHGSPPVELQIQLSKLAQEWANKLIANGGRLDMAPEPTLGQNIFRSETDNLTLAVNDAIHNWYYAGKDEFTWKDLSKNWYNSLALEFSQLVWKDSKFFGCGAATNGISAVVIVFYHPAGNIVIEDDEEASRASFKSNVKKLQVS